MRYLVTVIVLAGLGLGCGGGTTVTRLDPNSTHDLSGGWNDVDARQTAEGLILDCLTRTWHDNYAATHGGERPKVTVGLIRNLTSEHIQMEIIISDFERELINSAKVRFVASKEQRAEIREERWEQQEYATRETAKKLRAELGADFMLQGAFKQITDQAGKDRISFYQIDLEMVNIETMEKVWIGSQEIKKGITQGSRKW
ncbi:MAG: penicillin-binding protein activator LpoB [candidate division Zixibacteria bacterium]|nr:penicillin-binding protein activator LpoB [candidate division Zixibacteria bacterium]MDH3939132.1 penicillin-binding protein activator LpoB [candidate division Zixibacteria bacterium]MDH4034785.1 penicillin-binding protein activator LpoB [candidate division Zixibacteria bacterium]